MNPIPVWSERATVLGMMIIASACSSVSPEVKALFHESEALDARQPLDDAGLDAFVARCVDVADRVETNQDRFHSLDVAFDACGRNGSYAHASAVRSGLFARILPLALGDADLQSLLLIGFAWPGREDPGDSLLETQEFLRYLDQIERRTESIGIAAASYIARVQYMELRDRHCRPLSDSERDRVRRWIGIVESRRADLDSYWGRDVADRCERWRAALDRNRIGMVAEEIEGEDVAGARMKLSDFHGNVVVLSFWGFW